MGEQSGTPTIHEGEIIDYPIDNKGKLITRRSYITKAKPRLDAPPPSQPGSVDWTMNMMFRSTTQAFQMIESLVAGQGDNANERWIQFILTYKKWQLEGLKPTFNEVCQFLKFPADEFLCEFQIGVQQMMKGVAAFKASLAVPDIMDMVVERAKAEEGSVKDRELGLKIAGVIGDSGGVNIQVNNTNQVAVMNKGEREKQKTPLLQFMPTLTEIDDEVRSEE